MYWYDGGRLVEPILQTGQIIPTFTLPNMQGRPIRRTDYRGQRHLVLVFLPSIEDQGANAYLRALADGHQAIRGAGAEVLAIVRGVAASASVDLPFPVLLDANGAVTARFVPEAARAAVFVTDRYGELYYYKVSAETTHLPLVNTLVDWLTAIDNQCVI
jgi:peroxiredoxin